MTARYKTPTVPYGFIPCDWNEGDSCLGVVSYQSIDQYMRSDKWNECINMARNILSIPNQMLLRLTSGSDIAILTTILYASNHGLKHFRMRQNDYGQIKAFASLAFESIEYCTDNDLLVNIKPNSLVYLSNPGNPSCRIYLEDELIACLTAHQDSVFLIDLAYIEYHPEFKVKTLANLNNLIMFRTFSKYWGVPGVRLGAIAFSQNCEFLELYNELNSKNLSVYHYSILKQLFENKDKVVETRESDLRKLTEMAKAISDKFSVQYSAGGNFIRFDCINEHTKQALWNYLTAKSIMPRDLNHLPGYENSIRLSFRKAAYEKICL